MGILKVHPFDAGPVKSGISFSQGSSRGRTFFRLGLTATAQKEFFGRQLEPAKDAITLVVNTEPTLNHLMGIKVSTRDDPNSLNIAGGPHGSVSLKALAWRSGGGGKRPSVSLVIVNHKVSGGGISVKLPDWARPEADVSAAARGAR